MVNSNAKRFGHPNCTNAVPAEVLASWLVVWLLLHRIPGFKWWPPGVFDVVETKLLRLKAIFWLKHVTVSPLWDLLRSIESLEWSGFSELLWWSRAQLMNIQGCYNGNFRSQRRTMSQRIWLRLWSLSYPTSAIFFIHIPKCAGGSFMHDAKRIVSPTPFYRKGQTGFLLLDRASECFRELCPCHLASVSEFKPWHRSWKAFYLASCELCGYRRSLCWEPMRFAFQQPSLCAPVHVLVVG